MKIPALILRALEFFFVLLVLALVGNIIADAKSGNPSIINYVMFLAVWGMLTLFYLIAASINEGFAINPIIPVAVDGINVLLFFCGATALAAQLGVHNCGNEGYTKDNKVTNGSDNQKKRCQEAQAVDAFLWFAFAGFVGSFVLSLFAMKGTSVPRPSVIRGAGKV